MEMNAKILFKLLVITIVAEIFYVCTKYNLWELYIEYPNFCTTFLNDPKNCSLDYGELSTSFLERYEQFCENRFVSEKRIPSLPPCPCVPGKITFLFWRALIDGCHLSYVSMYVYF